MTPLLSLTDLFSLAADHYRVYLDEKPDYINAVFINVSYNIVVIYSIRSTCINTCNHLFMQGYKQKKAFIIAEGPMPTTVRNFWKMIYAHKSAVVVMLSDLVEGGKEASAQYWPSSGTYQYGEYTIDLLAEEKLKDFTVRKLSITHSKACKCMDCD